MDKMTMGDSVTVEQNADHDVTWLRVNNKTFSVRHLRVKGAKNGTTATGFLLAKVE